MNLFSVSQNRQTTPTARELKQQAKLFHLKSSISSVPNPYNSPRHWTAPRWKNSWPWIKNAFHIPAQAFRVLRWCVWCSCSRRSDAVSGDVTRRGVIQQLCDDFRRRDGCVQQSSWLLVAHRRRTHVFVWKIRKMAMRWCSRFRYVWIGDTLMRLVCSMAELQVRSVARLDGRLPVFPREHFAWKSRADPEIRRKEYWTDPAFRVLWFQATNRPGPTIPPLGRADTTRNWRVQWLPALGVHPL